MRDLRIVFMGTPDFAVHILDKVVQAGYSVVGVITAPDKPAGRGRKMNESAVKKYALSQGLNLLQPKNLKYPSFISELEALKPNLQIVVAFRMLPKIVWNLPEFGTFNLHASLLPEYRGAAPIHWAIINGETKSGVTTFFIDEKIDTGEIIFQEETNIEDDDTLEVLYGKLMSLGGSLVLKTVDAIENDAINTESQPDRELKSAPKLTSENTRINWNDSLDNIYNHIRGLNPFPAAWTKLLNNGEIIDAKIFGVEKEYDEHSLENGTIITSKKSLKVAVKNGYIIIHEIKLSGKRKMDTQSLLNGYGMNANAKMR